AEKITKNFDVYNIGSIDWITVNDVARITVETLGLKNVSFSYKPMLHGVGWRGDVKRIALSIEKLRKAGFTPRFKSREAVEKTVESFMKELF
ncbi:MAG: UDP-glucose 4-epimerase, partial [Candidatus Desulfofervidus auxilii]|nr:UDP-glucose 4-epimerase [Candidatus Desulfofervidus auxilii]